MASARFLQARVMEFFSHGAADDVILQRFERQSEWDTLIEVSVRRIVSNPLLTAPVAGFIKTHVDSTLDECRLSSFR